MGTEAATYKRNLESSILFMQQQHADTIKGLHEEIASLQKRCTDLTFQLTMQGLTLNDQGATDEQLQELQHDLHMSKNSIVALKKDLLERDGRIQHLESEARLQRKRWLDESREHSQMVNSLRAELESKANNVAFLTTELHRLKQNQAAFKLAEEAHSHKSKNQVPPASLRQSGFFHTNATDVGRQPLPLHHHYIPIPPRDKILTSASSISRVRRSGFVSSAGENSRKPVVAVHPAVAWVNPQTLSGSNSSSGSKSPDITPFLPKPKENFVSVKPQQVLPPINPSSVVKETTTGDNSRSVLLHRVVSSASQHRPSSTQAEASIVTLAVESAVTSSGRTYAQESRSSEYN